jgi:uncharacterized membrane protein YccC
MVELIKWWKNKTFLTVLGIAVGTVGIAFLFAYFITWGWIPAIAVTCIGGLGIRRVIMKKLDEMNNNH